MGQQRVFRSPCRGLVRVGSRDGERRGAHGGAVGLRNAVRVAARDGGGAFRALLQFTERLPCGGADVPAVAEPAAVSRSDGIGSEAALLHQRARKGKCQFSVVRGLAGEQAPGANAAAQFAHAGGVFLGDVCRGTELHERTQAVADGLAQQAAYGAVQRFAFRNAGPFAAGVWAGEGGGLMFGVCVGGDGGS